MKKLLSVVLGGSALLMAASAYAATSDGDMSADGGTSEGTVDVKAQVPLKTRISDLDEIDFGNLGSKFNNDGVSEGVSDTQDVAVWSTSRAYTLDASGGEDGFVIKTSSTENPGTLAYTVNWKDSDGTDFDLASGSASGLVSNCKSVTCSATGDTKAQLTVAISAAEIEKALSGSYAGTLTLTVSAE